MVLLDKQALEPGLLSCSAPVRDGSMLECTHPSKDNKAEEESGKSDLAAERFARSSAPHR